MQLNRKHKATIITILIAMNLLMLVFNLSLTGEPQTLAETFIELPVADEETLEELEKQIEELKQQNLNKIESHDAINENEKFIKEFEETKSLEELRAEAAAKRAAEEAEASEGDLNSALAGNEKSLAEKEEEKKASNGDDSKKDLAQNFTTSRNSTVSYSLLERKPIYRIPNPTYTCIAGGKVVINITVNRFGDVVEASHNPRSSTTKNGCLIDNALKYAQKAKFNSSTKSSQIGTITYVFQSK